MTLDCVGITQSSVSLVSYESFIAMLVWSIVSFT